jgi:hypothetical protein
MPIAHTPYRYTRPIESLADAHAARNDWSAFPYDYPRAEYSDDHLIEMCAYLLIDELRRLTAEEWVVLLGESSVDFGFPLRFQV